MDLDLIRLELKVASMLAAAGVAVYAWFANRGRATNKRLDQHISGADKRFDAIEQRVTRLESALEHAPNRGDIGKLHSRLDDVANAVSRIEGENHAMARSLDLINQHLLERKS